MARQAQFWGTRESLAVKLPLQDSETCRPPSACPMGAPRHSGGATISPVPCKKVGQKQGTWPAHI